MKKIIDNLKSFFKTGKFLEYNYYIIEDTTVRCKRESEWLFKCHFKTYFTGCYGVEPIDPISIKNFGITDFKVFESDKHYLVEITLTEPGMLIGRQGRTIDGVKKYLQYNEKEVVIHLIESKLWNK